MEAVVTVGLLEAWVTVKTPALLVPPPGAGLMIVISRAPSGALALISNVALICVALMRNAEVNVIPVPEIEIDPPAIKLVPVIVIVIPLLP
jgi:hypothetical protein